jgi:hypothetical protein
VNIYEMEILREGGNCENLVKFKNDGKEKMVTVDERLYQRLFFYQRKRHADSQFQFTNEFSPF